MGVDRAWIKREAKSEGGQGEKLNAGRQLRNDEMWGVHRAHLGAHGDVARCKNAGRLLDQIKTFS